MNYLTLAGNNIINAKLPDGAEILYAPDAKPGIPRRDIPRAVMQSFENPIGMPPLRELVSAKSKILIAFDDNCQPFPETSRPDIRQQAIEALLSALFDYGVQKANVYLICAVALHRKMTKSELMRMVGPRIMRDYYPNQLGNFDAEDRENIAELEQTEEGEPVQICKRVVESDLVVYVDTVQIPLNGGHKSVAVGLGTYDSIASHHSPKMTESCPHVMQPEHSNMHASIERISRVVQKHAQIMVMEAAMNNATYPFHVRYLGKPPSRCNIAERILRAATPAFMAVTPEPIRKTILQGVKSAYLPTEINAGTIDGVHAKTLTSMKDQLAVSADGPYSTLVFGLPDLSPYSVGARINPVLVVSDVLGYIFNWFYREPFLKKGGVVIILNPVFEVFHPLYHVAYKKFYDEVLPVTTDPAAMQQQFQEQFARDPNLVDCYQNRYAHHGFHPFTVWYWATYALQHLSKVILVGPKDASVAKRLGVSWEKNLDRALAEACEITGDDDIVAMTIPPFFYVR